MNIVHPKSITISDGTNTNIVRPSDWNSSHNLALTISGNTSGASTWSGSNLVIAGGNNVTLQITGNTLSINATSGGGGTTISYFAPVDYFAAERIAGQIGNQSVRLHPVTVPCAVQFDRILEPLLISLNTGSTNTVSITFGLAIYSHNNSTQLTLLSSWTGSTNFTVSGTANSASISGARIFTWGATGTLSPGQYVLANWSRTSGSAATVSNLIASNMNTALSGYLNEATNASRQFMPWLGSYSATTTAFPNNIAISQVYGSAAVNIRPKLYILSYGTVV